MTADASTFLRAELGEILKLWESRRTGQSLPLVDAISPVEIAPYLDHVILVDVDIDSRRMSYVQVGRYLTEIYGENLDGVHLDELPRALRDYVVPIYQAAIDNGQPQYSEYTLDEPGWSVTFGRVVLPLRDEDSGKVAGLIVAVYPNATARRQAAAQIPARGGTSAPSLDPAAYATGAGQDGSRNSWISKR